MRAPTVTAAALVLLALGDPAGWQPAAARPAAGAAATRDTVAAATRRAAAPERGRSRTTARGRAAPARGAAGGPAREGAAPRRLQDIHIEGEIPVPQVLFITARDQRRFLEFRHRRYLRGSRELGDSTAFPSGIALIRNQPLDDDGKETSR
jgi:hypothetical protein